MDSGLSGFFLSLSLIVAIGAQNAFVLKQGLKKHYVFWVCSVCALSDAVLIFAGIAGYGAAIAAYPEIETAARYGGALFLAIYAVKSFYSAFGTSHALEPEGEIPAALWKTLLTCLAFTWLNPHVYLDTVVLLGAVSVQYEDAARVQFGIGAITASFVFFFSLGYGARFLGPLFQRPIAWKILDALIGLLMLFIAVSLVLA